MTFFRSILFTLFIMANTAVFAQEKTQQFEVAGNCAMCKNRIENAGREAGASAITWNIDDHQATVTFDSTKTSLYSIKKTIAGVGHDTKEFKAPDEVYQELHECCAYPRWTDQNDTQDAKSLQDEEVNATHNHSGEDHQLTGVVVNESDNGDLTPIPEVTVYWLDDPNHQVKSNENGVFNISHQESSSRLVFSHASIQGDTIEVKNPHEVLVIHSKNNALQEVIVSRRQKSNYINKLSPNRVETITAKELFKAACCDLSESFETNATVDVVSSDAVTGSKQIQMLGLAGIYTQLTVENLPGPRGFASPLGLNSISGTWIESINISKGIGSVANGFENMAGQINVELKKPHTSERLFFNAYANNMGRTDVNLNLAHHINEKWSVGLLLHDNFMYNKKMNFSGNGFRDLPVGNLFSGVNRWHYEDGKGIIAQFGIKYLHDDRVGGQVDFDENQHKLGVQVYGLGFKNQRIEGFGKLGYVFPSNKHRSIGLQLSASKYKQESFFGITTYDNDQQSLYANLLYQDLMGSVAHKYKVGASVQHDNYNEDLVFRHLSVDQSLEFGRRETVSGLFAEYTFSPSDQFDAVLGLRQDYNNLYGWFTTPRAVLRYEPVMGTTFRLSSGRGWRTANIFAENLGIFASSRSIAQLSDLVEGAGAYGLKPETSWSTGFTFDQDFHLFGREAGLSLELFHNNFQNQVVVDFEDVSAVHFYNLAGKSYSNSLQAEFRFLPLPHFEVRTAYRYLDVQTDYQVDRLQKPLTAKHRGFLNLAYTPHGGWSFDYTLNAVGKKRIPNTANNPEAYQLPRQSDAYVTMNAQVTRSFGTDKKFDVYLGGENLTNFYQKDPILAFDQPFGEHFDTNMLWGPITGRMFYLGVRYHLP